MLYRYNKIRVLLCIILVNAFLQPYAFALRPAAYELSAQKTSAGGSLLDSFKERTDYASSGFVTKKPKWAIDLARDLYGDKKFIIEHVEASNGGTTPIYGETYFEHANNVADVLIELDPEADELAVAAALLHIIDINNIEEDITAIKMKLEKSAEAPEAEYHQKDINKVIEIIRGANRVNRIPYLPPNKEDGRTIQNQMNMIIQVAKTPETMLLAFAEKLEVLMTTSDARWDYVSREITHVYAPLAERLGEDDWAAYLRDIILEVSYPDLYDEVVSAIEEKIGMNYQDALTHLEKVEEKVRKDLKRAEISADVTTRLKGIYSTYEKMQSLKREQYGRNNSLSIDEVDKYIDEIHDLFGITMVFDNEDDLWLASHIPFLYGEGIDKQTNIKKDEESEKFGIEAFHAGIKNRENNRFYEFQLITRDNYYNRRYGAKAHWAYKLARETRQKFDVDEIERTGDFYEDFHRLKQWLDNWVFVFKEVDDIGGRTAFKPLRFISGSIPADFAATKSVNLLNEDYHKAEYTNVYYDIKRDRIVRLSKKELKQADTLKSATVVDILVKNKFLRKSSKTKQVIKKRAKMLRTHLLLDNLNPAQMRQSAEKGRRILEERNIPSISRLRGLKNKNEIKSPRDNFLCQIALSLGLMDETELCAIFAATNKAVLAQTEKHIRDYALEEKRNALKKGRQLLEKGDNRLDLNDKQVLESLELIYNNEFIRTNSFDASLRIRSLQEFFVAIGNNKIDAELVKSALSTRSKKVKIRRPDILESIESAA